MLQWAVTIERGEPLPVIRCTAATVSSSAGKNNSSASSESVTSTGVPKIVVVLKSIRPASVWILNGITTAYSSAEVGTGLPAGVG